MCLFFSENIYFPKIKYVRKRVIGTRFFYPTPDCLLRKIMDGRLYVQVNSDDRVRIAH